MNAVAKKKKPNARTTKTLEHQRRLMHSTYFRLKDRSQTSCEVYIAACTRYLSISKGIVGFWVQGPAALQLRDCTFGADRTAFVFDNGAPASPFVPTELALKHVSVQVGLGPVLRSTRTAISAARRPRRAFTTRSPGAWATRRSWARDYSSTTPTARPARRVAARRTC